MNDTITILTRSKSKSTLTANCYVNIFNWLSRILAHCLIADDFTALRWEVTNNSFHIDLLEHILYDEAYPEFTKIKKAFHPSNSSEISLYILFSNNNYFVEFHQAVFSDDIPILIINLPYKSIINEGEDMYDSIEAMFYDIFANTMELKKYQLEWISNYHTKLLLENGDNKQSYPFVEEAFNKFDVFDHSKHFPFIGDKNKYIQAIKYFIV